MAHDPESDNALRVVVTLVMSLMGRDGSSSDIVRLTKLGLSLAAAAPMLCCSCWRWLAAGCRGFEGALHSSRLGSCFVAAPVVCASATTGRQHVRADSASCRLSVRLKQGEETPRRPRNPPWPPLCLAQHKRRIAPRTSITTLTGNQDRTGAPVGTLLPSGRGLGVWGCASALSHSAGDSVATPSHLLGDSSPPRPIPPSISGMGHLPR